MKRYLSFLFISYLFIYLFIFSFSFLCLYVLSTGSVPTLYPITTYLFAYYYIGDELVPVVGEDYGEGTFSYKAVAVVKANSAIRFSTLKGKKSCHTGAGKTAGWNVPVGTLLRQGIMMPDKSCNAYVAASKFFKESCVPSKLELTFPCSLSIFLG